MPSDEKGDKPPPELKPYCYRLTTDRESHSQHRLIVDLDRHFGVMILPRIFMGM
jgi:hypothetical protein